MTQQATREDIDEVISIVQDFVGQVDTRFNRLEARFENLETEIGKLIDSHNRLLTTVDGFIARIDKYETELAARDAQFEKLLSWARKVSEKTGIPLENL